MRDLVAPIDTINAFNALRATRTSGSIRNHAAGRFRPDIGAAAAYVPLGIPLTAWLTEEERAIAGLPAKVKLDEGGRKLPETVSP